MDQMKLTRTSRGLHLLFISGALTMAGILFPLLGLAVICVSICALLFMYGSHRNYMIALFVMLLRTGLTVFAVMNTDLTIGTIVDVAVKALWIFEIGLICMATDELVRGLAAPVFPNGGNVMLVSLIGTLAQQVTVRRPSIEILAMMSEVMVLVSAIMAMVFYRRASKILGQAARDMMEQARDAASFDEEETEFFDEEE